MRGQTAMARPHPRNRAKFTRQWGHFRLYLRGIMLHSDDRVAEKCGRHFGTTAFRGISGISDGHFGTVWCEPIAPSARNEGKNLTWCQSCQPFPHRSGGFWDKALPAHYCASGNLAATLGVMAGHARLPPCAHRFLARPVVPRTHRGLLPSVCPNPNLSNETVPAAKAPPALSNRITGFTTMAKKRDTR